jgi:hypothetical protein
MGMEMEANLREGVFYYYGGKHKPFSGESVSTKWLLATKASKVMSKQNGQVRAHEPILIIFT